VKKIVLAIMLLLCVIAGMGSAFPSQPVKAGPSGEAEVLLETDKRVYILGENVTITLKNIGYDTVMFGGWLPWMIYTYPYWKPVYPYALAFLAWDLDPEESVVLSWDQFDEYNETFVEPGRYVVYEHNYGHRVFFDIASSASCVTDGLNVTLTVSRPTMIVGEELSITISVTNIAPSNVSLQPCYGSAVFDIIASNETFPWRWSDGKYWIMIVLPPIVLSPGETYYEQKEWNLYIYSDGESIPPAPGNYTLTVFAFGILSTPLLPIRIISEVAKADVTHDGEVDIYDAVSVCVAYGSTPKDPEWNPCGDIAEPYGEIDIFDVVTVCTNYGRKWR
jgi:hypothetical protein